MAQLRCEECEADLHSVDVAFADNQARCRKCGAVVTGGVVRRRGAKIHAALPRSIDVSTDAGGEGGPILRVRVPWRLQNPQAATQLGVVCLLLVLAITLEQLDFSSLAVAGISALPVFLFVAVRLINHTLITVEKGAIVMQHAPFPWFSRTIDAHSIEQLYVDRRPLAQHRFDYSVKARVGDGDEMVFFRSLSSPIAALQLEHSIEEHLDIEDAPISGELGPEKLS